MIKVGLRIDVDTFRGTRHGVLNLCKLLKKYNIRATFFFSVGPDNMGRHLWRLIRPDFLKKMLRSKAASLYGWDIIFKGTFCQGPIIGEKLGYIIKYALISGHEIGFHAWDHHRWQSKIENMKHREIYNSIYNGVKVITNIIGSKPVCSAVAGWKCNNKTLLEKSKFPFLFNSDCRGENIFYPSVNGKVLYQPQIPVTMPTYDEVIGFDGVSKDNYNEFIISLVKSDKLNVLTIHAEVEGISCLNMFEDFLKISESKNIKFIPLGYFLKQKDLKIIQSEIIAKKLKGREGFIAYQAL